MFFRTFLKILFYFFTLSAITLGVFAKPAFADIAGLVGLINSYRQQNELGVLTEDQNLTNAACWFANDMGAKNYFPSDHVDSLGRSMGQRLSDYGVGGSRAENIFYTTAGANGSYAFNAWKNSSGHNANMLSSTYTRIGVGRAYYNNRYYWVADFANGSANTLTNQCGVIVAQNQTPKPSVKSAPKPAPPAAPTENPVVVEVKEILPVIEKATPSATISSVKIKQKQPQDAVAQAPLVQGLAVSGLLLFNLGIVVFIGYKFFKHFKS